MNYFDLHCDTASECCRIPCGLRSNGLHISLERTEKYEKWAQIFAVWTNDSLRGENAFRYFKKVAEFFAGEIQKNADIAVSCRSSNELRKNIAGKKRIALLSIEGSASLAGKIEHLYDARQLGVRLITLTWNGHCEAGDGCGVPNAGGLTSFGKELVKEMNRTRTIVDVSHLSEKGFWDVARIAERPFVATHSNSKTVCRSERNLSDSQFREIVRDGGLVGINLFRDFVKDGSATPDDLMKHVDHFLHLGGERILAVGSDFDGCSLMDGINGVEDMDRLYRLIQKKFGEETAKRIFWENACRFFTNELS